MVLVTACGGGAGSSGSSTGAGGGSAASCPAQDSARLFVDGVEILPLKIIGGGGTGTPPTEAETNVASLILSTMAGGGDQKEAFVFLRGLVAGQSASLASSSVEYRVYPKADGGGPPSTDVTYSAAKLTGTLDVAAIAVKPGDAICGTFDLTGQGTPAVRVQGGFHHVWQGPTPGG